MPKRHRSGSGHSDRLISVHSRLGAHSPDAEPGILAPHSKDTCAFGSLHPNHIDSSLLDLSQDILNAQHTHTSSLSPHCDVPRRDKLISEECTSVLLRLFSMPGEQNTPPAAEDFGSVPNLTKPSWSPSPSPPSRKEHPARGDAGDNSPLSSASSTPPRKVLAPSNVDNQMGRQLQSALRHVDSTQPLQVPASASGQQQPLARQPRQPLPSPASQSCTYVHSVSPEASYASRASHQSHAQQAGSDADVSGLTSDQSLPMAHAMGSPIQSISTAVIPMPSYAGSVSTTHSPTTPQLSALHLKGDGSLHRPMPRKLPMSCTGSPPYHHSPQRMDTPSSISSVIEPFSACVHTALFGDHDNNINIENAHRRDSQPTVSASCTHGIPISTAHIAQVGSTMQGADTQGNYPGVNAAAPCETSQSLTRRNTDTRDHTTPPSNAAGAVAESAGKPPARGRSFFSPHSPAIASSPQLAYASIVLLAISGVMGLAYCSAFILILLDDRSPDSTVLTSLLLLTEAVFAASCCLQWWLVAQADRMFDCLKWAGNPAGSLPVRASRSLVLSTSHKFTWFALVGQLVASVVLVALIAVSLVFSETPFNLLAVLTCLARVTIFACNYVFIYEALQSWLPLPLLGSFALHRCIASDAELLFLASTALYTIWEVLNIIGAAGGSNNVLASVAGVLLGGGALARTFGASLLLWARNSALQDQTVEERKLRAMLNNWYVPPEEASKTNRSSQRYLDASAVATRLMVPDSLPRALSLQNLASCGAVLVILLNVARQLKRGRCQLDSYLVHMLHILTAGAEIVQNHNQRRCVSVVYVAHDETARDEPQRHVLMVQQLHPHRVDQLPGQQRLDTRRMQQVKLKLTHVIPMLLSLDSKLSGTERRVFDDEGPAATGVKAFAMQSSQDLANQQDSNSSPTAVARSSPMQSCDIRSSTQRTPGTSSNAVVPAAATPGAVAPMDSIIQTPAGAVQEGRQHMQWPLVKGLTEVQSPGSPGSQKAGPSNAVPAGTGKAELEMKSGSSGALTKWEPLPCLPSQIVAGYAFVIDGPVAPEIGSSKAGRGSDSVWPSITAVELNAQSIKAICKVGSKELRHDASLVRTDSMDALVQVHVMPPGSQGNAGEAISASDLRGPEKPGRQSDAHTASQGAAAIGATPWASGEQVEEVLNNLGVSAQGDDLPQTPQLTDSDAQEADDDTYFYSSSGEQAAVKAQSTDADTDPLATPKPFSGNNSHFSTSRPHTSLSLDQEPAAPPEAARISDARVPDSPEVPPQSPLGVSGTPKQPAHKNNVSVSSPWDINSQDLSNHVWSQKEDNQAKPSASAERSGWIGVGDAPSRHSDKSSSSTSAGSFDAFQDYRSSSIGAQNTMPPALAQNNRLGASSSPMPVFAQDSTLAANSDALQDYRSSSIGAQNTMPPVLAQDNRLGASSSPRPFFTQDSTLGANSDALQGYRSSSIGAQNTMPPVFTQENTPTASSSPKPIFGHDNTSAASGRPRPVFSQANTSAQNSQPPVFTQDNTNGASSRPKPIFSQVSTLTDSISPNPVFAQNNTHAASSSQKNPFTQHSWPAASSSAKDPFAQQQHYTPTSARKKKPAYAQDNKSSASSSKSSHPEDEDSYDLDFYLPLPPGTLAV